MRWIVRRHGFPAVATVATGGGGFPGTARRSRLDPSVIVAPSSTAVAAVDRLAVDAARHPAGELHGVDRPVGADGDKDVVWLDRRVVDAHRRGRRPPDDVAAGRERRRAARCRTGLADEDGHRRRRRRGGNGDVEPAAAHDTGPGEGVAAGDVAAVERQRRARSQADRIGEIAEAIVRRPRDDVHPPAGSLDLQGMDMGMDAAAMPPWVAASRAEAEIL